MKKTVRLALFAVVAALTLAGCSTLAVKAPPGMFLSTGDYVPGVQTLGIVQAQKTVIAPLFIVDVSKIHQQLYHDLISRSQRAGANGVTDIKFSFRLAPVGYATTLIGVPIFIYYIEGVAIKH